MLKAQLAANPVVTVRDLDIGDLQQVFSLFSREFPTLEHGFMAHRTIEEFGAILSDAVNSVAKGAFQGDDLIGYSLARLEHRPGMDRVPFLRDLADEKSNAWPKVWCTKGALIDRRFRRNRLMARLQIARSEAGRKRGIAHSLGLIALGNTASLSGMFRARFWAVGLEEDEYCLNFLCYRGTLSENRQTTGKRMIDCGDVAGLADAFATGWVGTGLRSDGSTGRKLLEMTRPDPFTSC